VSGFGDFLSGLAFDSFELWLIGPSERDIEIRRAARAHKRWDEEDLGALLAAFNPLDFVKGEEAASAYRRAASSLAERCSAYEPRTRGQIEEALWAGLESVDRRPPRDALRFRRLVRRLARMHTAAYSRRYSQP